MEEIFVIEGKTRSRVKVVLSKALHVTVVDVYTILVRKVKMGLIGHVDENLGSLLMSNPVHKESGLLALFLILPKAERALPLRNWEQTRLLF